MKIITDFSKLILKWLVICLIVGFLAGASSAFFLYTLNWATQFREGHLWLIFLLPLGGLMIGLLYHYYGKEVVKGNNLILEEYEKPEKTIPLKMAPLVYIGTILTHFFGGSAGREGTAVQMSTAIADQFTAVFNLSVQERKIILIIGVSGGFASVFGTPLTGAVFALELLYFSRVSVKSIIPSFLTAYIAYYTVEFFQISHTHYQHPIVPAISIQIILWIILVGILSGLSARMFSTSVHFFSTKAKEFISYPPLRPFFGGIMDAFRQPKYSYYMFMSQRENNHTEGLADTGPMVYIAHEMTPFSPKDVTVYSNCDEVRLTFLENGNVKTNKRDINRKGMPYPIITFTDMYDFMTCKWKARANKQDEVYLLAEGIKDGKVVAIHKVAPSGQANKIILTVDHDNMGLLANGSDFVTLIASVVDKNENVKRLNNNSVRFSIEGEGRILGSNEAQSISAEVLWGTAPILVQSTTKAGKIRITASVDLEGENTPLSGQIEIVSINNNVFEIFNQNEVNEIKNNVVNKTTSKSLLDNELEVKRLRKELNSYKLKEVEDQQKEFGVGIN